jgi:branched-subunit amino acid transport protein AzlD
MLSLPRLVIAVFVCAAATFATRVVPFVLFPTGRIPRALQHVIRFLPPVVMAALLIFSFKDVDFRVYPHGIPALAGLALTVGLHLWRRSSLLSIFGGTAAYMVLIRVMTA